MSEALWRMDKSLFDNDLRIEHELARYLDDNLYRAPLFTEFRRTPGAIDQKRGSDIILSSDALGLHSAIADEKATMHHINKDITTFAFELSYKSKESDDRVTGWFLDDSKETEAYMLLWPFVKQVDIRGRFDAMTYDDIAGVRYLLVKRAKIRAYLAKRGFTKQVLLQKAAEIANSGLNGRIDVDSEMEDYHFYFYSSLDYAEKPVNLVIDRPILWCLGDKKGGIIGNPAKSRIRPW